MGKSSNLRWHSGFKCKYGSHANWLLARRCQKALACTNWFNFLANICSTFNLSSCAHRPLVDLHISYFYDNPSLNVWLKADQTASIQYIYNYNLLDKILLLSLWSSSWDAIGKVLEYWGTATFIMAKLQPTLFIYGDYSALITDSHLSPLNPLSGSLHHLVTHTITNESMSNASLMMLKQMKAYTCQMKSAQCGKVKLILCCSDTDFWKGIEPV